MKIKHLYLKIILLGIFSCYVVSQAHALAQNIKGTITGKVIDAQGRAIAGSEVTITDTLHGSERRLLSDSEGSFYQPGLDPGNYTVEILTQGFEPFHSGDLQLRVGDTLRLEVPLKVSGIATAVRVSAYPPTQLQLEDVKQSKNFDEKEMNDLPVQAGSQGRNFYAQALTAPGVALSTLAHRPFAVSGQRPRNNNYLIDSVETNDANTGFIAGRAETEQLISQEAVKSFEIITHNFKAEYGRNSGAIVSLVSKSGTNELHGSAYEYHNNSALSARNPFETQKSSRRSNLAGFTVGGPIKKERVFFFGNYELFKQRGEDLHTFQTLTDEERASAVAAVRPLVNLYPRSPNNNRLISKGSPTIGDQNTYLIRGDILLTDRQTLTARINYIDSQRDIDGIGNTVSSHVLIHNQTQGTALHHNYTIRPTLLNELRLGYHRQTEEDAFLDPVFLGSPAVSGEIGFLIVSGLSLGGPLGFLGRANHQNNFQVSDDVSWTRNRHVFKLGSALRRIQVNGGNINNTFRGTIFFPNIASFLAGQPLSYSRNFGNPMIGLRRTEWDGYVQDDWKIAPRLTLNIGLRYELYSAPSEASGRIQDRYRFTTDYNDWAPRFGLAWAGLPKTVVRAGYGIFYNAVEMAFLGLTRFNPPLIESFSAFRPTLPDLLSRATKGIPSGLVIPDRNTRTPRAQHITLAAERELWNPQSTLSVSYVGTLGTKISRTRRPNGGENLAQKDRPDPSIGVVNRLETSALSNYHALQIGLSLRLMRDLQARAAYSYSKFIDDVSEIADSNTNLARNVIPLDETNLRLDRSVSDFDIPHLFTLSYIYRLPFLRQNPWLGGWTISGISTLQSGRPFTLYSGTNNLSGTANNRINDIPGTLSRRPSSATPVSLIGSATLAQLTPAAGTLGTLARNSERGDSLLNWNISVAKDIKVTEAMKIQVRGEMFNLFNVANFNEVEGVLSSPNFGRALSAFDPRRAQLAVRFVF